MADDVTQISNEIEKSVKMRPSQKAILKVIEHSIRNGEMDSAVELTKKLGVGLKENDKQALNSVLYSIPTFQPYMEKAAIITKSEAVKFSVKPKIKVAATQEEQSSQEGVIQAAEDSTVSESVTKQTRSVPIDAPSINQSGLSELFEESGGETKLISVEAEPQISQHHGEIIQIDGEVIQIGDEIPVKDQSKKVKPEDIFGDEDDFDSLGIDLIPEEEKKQIQEKQFLDGLDGKPLIDDGSPINIQQSDMSVESLNVTTDHLNIATPDEEKADDYNSLGVDLTPPKEKGDVSQLLDQMNKEISSFPGSQSLTEKPLLGSGKPETRRTPSAQGGDITTDEDIESIINAAGNKEDDSVFHIEEPPGMGGYPGGFGQDNQPFIMGDRQRTDPALQQMLQAQALASQGNLIDPGYKPEFLPNISTPGQRPFEYSPVPGDYVPQETSPGQSPGIDSGLGDALKSLLKDALTGAFDNLADTFKDENKDLFDKVERTKPKIETPAVTMPEIEEPYDEGKAWSREAKDTEFKVSSFDEGPDESVGKYDIYDDEEETPSFKDSNKDLFDNIVHESKEKLSTKLEDYDTEKDLNVEHKTTMGGNREIVVTNLDADKKRKKPPKKPPKRVRLSFSFRNLFNNKVYIKYKEILNRAAILVAEKKLDEALDYYYTIRDQNIPNVFKMMVQQNIDDIEETIMNTFQYSDTIVKLKDSGRAIRLRDINEFERQIKEKEKSKRAGKRGEVFLDEVGYDDEYAYEYEDEGEDEDE